MEQPSFKWLIVEGGVIVASILFAFAVDAWWESRQEDEAAQWLIDRLYADFMEIRTDLDDVMRRHEVSLDAAVQLYEHDGVLPVNAETDGMLKEVFLGFTTFNPGSGAVEVFLNNEASRLVENQPLADLLIRWSAVVEDLKEEEALLALGVDNRWRPYLASKVDFRGLFGARDRIVRDPLDADREFFVHVSDRLLIQQLAVRDMQAVSDAVNQILKILEQEATSD
ncbi:MAG: hypothetical protein ACR2PZ_00620 [Pseudomonadales bacterium]